MVYQVLDSAQAAEFFRKAAELITQREWIRLTRETDEGFTADAALCEVIHGDASRAIANDLHNDECDEAYQRFAGFLIMTAQTRIPSWKSNPADIISNWNDDRYRTRQQVIDVFHAAADALKAEHQAGR